jgi:hypothetical protein
MLLSIYLDYSSYLICISPCFPSSSAAQTTPSSAKSPSSTPVHKKRHLLPAISPSRRLPPVTSSSDTHPWSATLPTAPRSSKRPRSRRVCSSGVSPRTASRASSSSASSRMRSWARSHSATSFSGCMDRNCSKHHDHDCSAVGRPPAGHGGPPPCIFMIAPPLGMVTRATAPMQCFRHFSLFLSAIHGTSDAPFRALLNSFSTLPDIGVSSA